MTGFETRVDPTIAKRLLRDLYLNRLERVAAITTVLMACRVAIIFARPDAFDSTDPQSGEA